MPPRKRLKELTSRTFDMYLNEEAPRGKLIVVACGSSHVPQWRRIEPNLEALNGRLHAQAKAAESGGGGSSGVVAGGSAVELPPFELCKIDLVESRYMHERYRVKTPPAFFMYYNGKLVYAKNTLNGYGSSTDDLIAQVKLSLDDAQKGNFLPDDFQFTLTDNATVEKFADTLGATAPILGKQQ